MMSRIRNFLTLLLLSFLWVACSTDEDEKQFRIQGIWELQSITDFNEYVTHYPVNGMTSMRIYDDSCYYECKVETAPTGTMITPSVFDFYTFVDKGHGNVLYLHGEYTHPLSVLNDSVMVIQEYGRQYTWKRSENFEEERCKDIIDVIRNDVEDNDSVAHHYVFSKAEKELKADKHLLIYIVIGVVLVFAVLSYRFYQTRKDKKRIEQQLQRIEQERQAMPEPVRQVLNTLEEDFLQSDFYLSMHQRIGNGGLLKKEDWEQLDAQIKSVYPGFANKLMSLCHMSRVEYQMCLLLKLNFTPSEIANVLCKDTSSISSMRSRLYGKVFGKKGGSREWDEFVRSL